MACISSNAFSEYSSLLADRRPIDNYSCVVAHAQGIFGIANDGSYVQLEKSAWREAALGINTGEEDMLYFHGNGIYRFSAHDDGYSRVSSERWRRSKIACHIPHDPNGLFLLHEAGVYKVDATDGSFSLLSSDGWGLANCAVFKPDCGDGNAGLFVFHDWALYRVDLTDGSWTKLGNERWSLASAAVYDPQDGTAVVFHDWGCFRDLPCLLNGRGQRETFIRALELGSRSCARGRLYSHGNPPTGDIFC